MSWYIYLGAAVELVQLAIIFLLVFSHRRLRRRLDEDLRFTRRPPGSITEESPYHQLGASPAGESRFEIARRA
ncbi:MAG: hypothetical protein QOF61_1110 [Acidobacteriota bacterium]|jgi:hypothetical protein|nr:hypothetical protein [Acidobacteriota bacterium]